MRTLPLDTKTGKARQAPGDAADPDVGKPLLDLPENRDAVEGGEKRAKLLVDSRPITADTDGTCQFFADRIEFRPGEPDPLAKRADKP